MLEDQLLEVFGFESKRVGLAEQSGQLCKEWMMRSRHLTRKTLVMDWKVVALRLHQVELNAGLHTAAAAAVVVVVSFEQI